MIARSRAHLDAHVADSTQLMVMIAAVIAWKARGENEAENVEKKKKEEKEKGLAKWECQP